MKKIILILMISILACDFDQNKKTYDNYEKAKLDNLFEKNWIPKELIYKSMSNIIVKSNLDINTCLFSYKLSKKDFEHIESKIKTSQIEFKKPQRIDISNSLNKKLVKLDKFSFVSINTKDTVQIAIDNKTNEIYGWY